MKLTIDELSQRVRKLEQQAVESSLKNEALREKVKLLQQAQQLTHAGSYRLDLKTNAVAWTDECSRIFGYEPGEVSPTIELIRSHIHPEDRVLFTQAVAVTETDGRVSDISFRITRKDGKIRTIRSRTFAEHDLAGKPHLKFTALQDITEQEQTREALHFSEDRFLTAFNTSPDSININRLTDGLYIDVNQGFTSLTGYKREEVIGKTSLEINIWSNPEDRDRLLEGLKKNGFVKNLEAKFLLKDGTIKTGLMSAKIIMLNEVPHILSVTREIEELKKAEMTLRESEEKYRQLFDNAIDAIFIAQDGFIKFSNPKTREMIGYTSDELPRIPFIDLIHPDFRELVSKRHQKRLAGEKLPSTYSFKIIHRSGEELWVMISAVLITWDGRPATLNFLRDITPQKKLEAQLRQAQKMEAIGTLAGGIAHDFNNILGAIMGYTELAMSGIEKNSLPHLNLREAMFAAERAKELVKQILAFSRQAEQEFKPVQVKQIVKESLKLLRASIPTTVEIRQDIRSDALVSADPTQIHQVMMNLCANAEHAMRQNGGVLAVKLEDVELDESSVNAYQDLKPGAYVKLSVSDTGCGMPGHVLERVFDPFFTTKQEGEGSGMGLSVVHGIVESSGGIIRAKSRPGQGTIFTVCLPVIERHPVREIIPEKPDPTGNERVLFVDDEPALVNISKQILESLGYDVTTRTSSIEALELFKTRSDQFDLVITDMTMPHMTGEELAAECMRVKPGIPVILCTGFTAKIDENAAMAMGIRAFVTKPVLRKDIALTIRKVLAVK